MKIVEKWFTAARPGVYPFEGAMRCVVVLEGGTPEYTTQKNTALAVATDEKYSDEEMIRLVKALIVLEA